MPAVVDRPDQVDGANRLVGQPLPTTDAHALRDLAHHQRTADERLAQRGRRRDHGGQLGIVTRLLDVEHGAQFGDRDRHAHG